MSEPPLCTIAQLKHGTFTIDDLADMHEVLDLKEENQRRFNAGRKER